MVLSDARGPLGAMAQMDELTVDRYWDEAEPARRRDWALDMLNRQPGEVLDRLAASLEDTHPDAGSPDRAPQRPAPAAVDASGSIFVVHGHARAMLHEAVRVLERGTGREVIVLHEQPNSGRMILEKLEDHAAGVRTSPSSSASSSGSSAGSASQFSWKRASRSPRTSTASFASRWIREAPGSTRSPES
jgi:hypothetical protein